MKASSRFARSMHESACTVSKLSYDSSFSVNHEILGQTRYRKLLMRSTLPT